MGKGNRRVALRQPSFRPQRYAFYHPILAVPAAAGAFAGLSYLPFRHGFAPGYAFGTGVKGAGREQPAAFANCGTGATSAELTGGGPTAGWFAASCLVSSFGT